MNKIIWVWHCHHDVLLEFLTEPFKTRVNYIKKEKPKEEQKLRLRLFKRVKGALPPLSAEWKKADAEWKKACAERKKAYAEWTKACAEREKADAERTKACAEWKKADAEWKKAYAERKKAYAEWKETHKKEIDILHKKECKNCPWDGKTIFPKK